MTASGFSARSQHAAVVLLEPELFGRSWDGDFPRWPGYLGHIQVANHSSAIEYAYDGVRLGKGEIVLDVPVMKRDDQRIRGLRFRTRAELVNGASRARFLLYDWRKGRWHRAGGRGPSVRESLDADFFHPELRILRVRIIVEGEGEDARMVLRSLQAFLVSDPGGSI